MSELEYSVAGHIAKIVLNRPKRKNAVTLGLVDQWAAALVAAERDRQARVVVVAGSGEAFCSSAPRLAP